MSCHGCSETFGFLNREKGCPKCGFAYCKKCLRFKIQIEGKTQSVCKACHEIETNPEARKKLDRTLSFSEAVHVMRAINRLNSLEDPAKPPIILYSKDAKPDINNLRVGMTPEDQALVDRLANLRNSQKSRRKSQDPAEDIALRLAQLRGESLDGHSSNQNINPLLMSKKPETEDDLLNRLGRETDLDKKYSDNLVSDIEARLERLRQPVESPHSSKTVAPGQSMPSAPVIPEQEQLTQAEEVERIIERVKAELEIDKESGQPIVELDVSYEEPMEEDHDNFCRICDAAATVGCKECDGEVYCAACFQEFHREIGENHKPFKINK